MSLRLADELTTRHVVADREDAAPGSEVLINGEPSGRVVSGAVLEAALGWDDRYLLFMTGDVPFEEMLGIHLLDSGLNVVDSALLGGPYTTGSFSALELSEPRTVRFRFIGDTTWSTELLSQPGFRIPLFSEPPGVRRPLGCRRHFIVRGNPRPQTERRM